MALDMSLEDWIESVRKSGRGNCFLHCKVSSTYLILNANQFLETPRISIIGPTLQITKEGSEWLKG